MVDRLQLNSKWIMVVISLGGMIAMQVGCRNSMNLPPRASQMGAKQPIDSASRFADKKRKSKESSPSTRPVQSRISSSELSPPKNDVEKGAPLREEPSMASLEDNSAVTDSALTNPAANTPALTGEQVKTVQSIVELTAAETLRIKEPEGSAKPPADPDMIEVEPIKRVLPGPEGLIAGKKVVREDDADRIIQSDGGDVVIAGNDGVIVLSGGCGNLLVEGNDNQIQADVVLQLNVTGSGNALIFGSFGKGSISGDRNELSWSKGIAGSDPSITDEGEDNVTQRSE